MDDDHVEQRPDDLDRLVVVMPSAARRGSRRTVGGYGLVHAVVVAGARAASTRRPSHLAVAALAVLVTRPVPVVAGTVSLPAGTSPMRRPGGSHPETRRST